MTGTKDGVRGQEPRTQKGHHVQNRSEQVGANLKKGRHRKIKRPKTKILPYLKKTIEAFRRKDRPETERLPVGPAGNKPSIVKINQKLKKKPPPAKDVRPGKLRECQQGEFRVGSSIEREKKEKNLMIAQKPGVAGPKSHRQNLQKKGREKGSKRKNHAETERFLTRSVKVARRRQKEARRPAQKMGSKAPAGLTKRYHRRTEQHRGHQQSRVLKGGVAPRTESNVKGKRGGGVSSTTAILGPTGHPPVSCFLLGSSTPRSLGGLQNEQEGKVAEELSENGQTGTRQKDDLASLKKKTNTGLL